MKHKDNRQEAVKMLEVATVSVRPPCAISFYVSAAYHCIFQLTI